jgi:hypothetical protein
MRDLPECLSTAYPKSQGILPHCHDRHMDLLALVSSVDLSSRLCTDPSNSMTGGMLILLAACRIPSLRERMGSEVTTLGSFLKQLIEPWMRVPGEFISPSVEQSLRMICEVDGFIKQKYRSGDAERDDHY